jgi:hypothetical protein
VSRVPEHAVGAVGAHAEPAAAGRAPPGLDLAQVRQAAVGEPADGAARGLGDRRQHVAVARMSASSRGRIGRGVT